MEVRLLPPEPNIRAWEHQTTFEEVSDLVGGLPAVHTRTVVPEQGEVFYFAGAMF